MPVRNQRAYFFHSQASVFFIGKKVEPHTSGCNIFMQGRYSTFIINAGGVKKVDLATIRPARKLCHPRHKRCNTNASTNPNLALAAIFKLKFTIGAFNSYLIAQFYGARQF